VSVDEKSSDSDSTVEVVARASMGGKSPRHYASLEEAEKYYRARLLKEKQNDKNLNKEHRMNTANKKIAKAQNPDFDSDMDSLPDVSSASEVTEDSDFEEEVMATASKKFKEWHKTLANSQPKATKKTPPQATFATPSGNYELCLLLLTLLVLTCFFVISFVESGKKKKGTSTVSPDVSKKYVEKGPKKQKLAHSGKKSATSSSSYKTKSSKNAPNSPGKFIFVNFVC
jgi:hypothetical protein